MKTKKGSYGYRTAHRRFQLTCVLVCLLAIVLQLSARGLTSDTAVRNILTVMAVLTVLPMANFASPMLASWSYKTPQPDFYHQVCAFEGSGILLYDLVVTSREQIIPLDAVIVHPLAIYGYCSSSHTDLKKAEAYVNEMLKQHRISLNMRMTCEKPSFFKRLESLQVQTMNPTTDQELCELAAALLKSISM